MQVLRTEVVSNLRDAKVSKNKKEHDIKKIGVICRITGNDMN